MSEVSLTISDEFGRTRQVLVQSKRFTIGRTPENDLAIENSNLSRRHAVIENFDGQVQITDCGSQNGTEVNGAPISPSAILYDGDLITLAGVCEIEVSITAAERGASATPARAISGVKVESPTGAAPRSPQVVPHSPIAQTQTSWLASPIFQASAVVAGLVVILGSIGLLLFVLRQNDSGRNSRNRRTSPPNDNQLISEESPTPEISSTSDPDNTRTETGNKSGGNGANSQQIEAAAIAVMRRLSSDDKTYSFSDKALQDIGRKVNQFRGSSTLAGNLAAVQRSSASLNSVAREEGMEPGLLIFVVLATMESHSGGDPKAVGQGAIGDLLALRATFGTNDADSSLIVLAAYKMGRGEKRSHPLLGTIRHLVRNPLTQRNVWYLNDRGGLDAAAYDFVLNVLALGVIAQNPGQFGVSANQLVF